MVYNIDMRTKKIETSDIKFLPGMGPDPEVSKPPQPNNEAGADLNPKPPTAKEEGRKTHWGMWDKGGPSNDN